MNELQPGIISKINTSGGDYKMMDNLNQWVLSHNDTLEKYLFTFLDSEVRMLQPRLLPTLKKISYLHLSKYELLKQLLIKSLNQPYYLKDSTKQFSENTLFSRFY